MRFGCQDDGVVIIKRHTVCCGVRQNMYISKEAVHYKYIFQKLRQCALLKLLVCTEDGKRCLNAS